MRITNPFQRFNSKPKPVKSTISGRLWINYTKRISSLELAKRKYANTVIKITVYMTTIFFVVMTTCLTLMADIVKYSYSSIYESLFLGKKTDPSKSSFSTQVAVGSVGISSIFACAYALRSYGIL